MRSAAVVAALLAAGCAGLQWDKSGTDAAARERDLSECRNNAHMQAQRETLPRAFTSPSPLATDPRGQLVVSQTNPRDADVMLLQQDLTRACMEGKGYRLVPTEKR